MDRTWALSYGLDLSPDKTNYMIFKDKNKQNIKNVIPNCGLAIHDKRLTRETQVKYLGVTIDHQLKWDAHIVNKITSARKLLFKL